MIGKKGSLEWPTFLIKSIFSMLLFIIGIFMVIDVANANGISFDGTMQDITFQINAARLIDSPDCWAWEEKVPGSYLVHAGTIDTAKLNNINSCLTHNGNKLPYSYEIKYISSGKSGIAASYGSLNTKHDEEWIAVKIIDGGKTHDGLLHIEL